MQSITIITPTGGRPEAFALCECWIGRQRWSGELQWIVVDDGPEPTPCTLGQTVIRPEPLWSEGQNTQARNLLAALPHVKHDRILIVEDDDWYAPDYFEIMAARLEESALVGERDTPYYHIAGRYLVNPNERHGSLFQTGMRGSILPCLESACARGERFLDITLFRDGDGKLFPSSGRSVGIKGLPGRPGIGMGHRHWMGWQEDRDSKVLRQWVGADAEAYKPCQ